MVCAAGMNAVNSVKKGSAHHGAITTSIALFTRRLGLGFAIGPWAPIVCAMPGGSLIALTL
ncbi:MAG TPA: hypothetical protein VN901_15125 [Candidatus Acidoferrales bacterium]|nr:hypothetical protein [Candidatus Acidoferrales bacterium]